MIRTVNPMVMFCTSFALNWFPWSDAMLFRNHACGSRHFVSPKIAALAETLQAEKANLYLEQVSISVMTNH